MRNKTLLAAMMFVCSYVCTQTLSGDIVGDWSELVGANEANPLIKTTVEQRVAQLEQRVAQLEQRVAQLEAASARNSETPAVDQGGFWDSVEWKALKEAAAGKSADGSETPAVDQGGFWDSAGSDGRSVGQQAGASAKHVEQEVVGFAKGVQEGYSGAASTKAGIAFKVVDDSVRKQIAIPAQYFGLLVTSVIGDSVAGRAGILQGDVIVSIGNSSVMNTKQFLAVDSKLDEPNGGPISFRIMRKDTNGKWNLLTGEARFKKLEPGE